MKKQNFTKNFIESLKPAEKDKRNYYKDNKVNFLEIMVTDKGNKSFKVTRKKNGKLIRVTLGKYPDISIENARNKAYELNSQISEGINPNQEKNKMKQEISFNELFKEFMERYSKKFKKSWKHDQTDVTKFCSQWFKRKISSITNNEVRLLHEKIRSENGLYQANRILERISAIYNKASEWGWVGINPAKGIKKFKEVSRERFLHSDELPRFFDSLNAEPNSNIRDYIYISLFTGARKSNVLAMKWEDINFERGEWFITETKNGSSLRVHLTQEVINILQERLKNSLKNKWVFEGAGKTGHLVEPKSGWKRILLRANIKDLRIHDLRRTLGSWQATTGANSYIIGQSLGHKNQQSTAIYARLSLDPVKDSVNRATQAMLNYLK